MRKKFEIPSSLGIYGNKETASGILSRIWGKKGTFTCTVSSTLTSTIPGISDAGNTPELTLFTGPADAEILVCGKAFCMNGIPINPGNIPTPATLTMAALQLSNMPCYIINGGCKIVPQIPFFDVGATYGEKITTGQSVKNVREIFEKGKILGKNLAKGNDFIVISESIAGGTTTALAVLMAMGILEENLVSSSSPKNPKKLKTSIVSEGLKAAGIKIGDLIHDPLKAIEHVGDPMQAVNVGMLIGTAKTIPTIMGGGTQMAAVIAAALELDPSIEGNIIHGTTRWLVEDRDSDICGIVDRIDKNVPLIYTNIDYSASPYEGLRAYEKGFIKDGVGCGGSSIAAIATSSGKIDCNALFNKVQDIYKEIINAD
ncbi:MAG: TIGR00303 family protein [archaeon]|nr:TIGR00303 family protein [archaeon]